MQRSTLISVLMSAYNTNFDIVKRAIDSVLNQTFTDFELIVIDDGSNNNTQSLLLNYTIQHESKIRYLRHANCGQSESINYGVKISNGEYITIIDADDEYAPNHLQSCLNEIKHFDLIASTSKTIVDKEQDYYVPDRNNTAELINVDDCILFATLFGKKNVFEDFPFQQKYSADATFYELASTKYLVNKLDLRTYIYYRNNPNSIVSIMKKKANIIMQKHITNNEILQMEQRQRATFINSLGGFKSVCLIGTIDEKGLTNLAVFSSIVHIGASPPLIAFILRPDSIDRNTLTNILETGYYTINHLNETIYKKGHQTSARYPKEISEFDEVGLIADYKDGFLAPYVKESSIQLGLQFKERVDLTINGTILIVGQIHHIYFPENCLCDDGFLDLEKANTITCSGLDSYHKTQRLERLSYAKPNTQIEHVKLKYAE